MEKISEPLIEGTNLLGRPTRPKKTLLCIRVRTSPKSKPINEFKRVLPLIFCNQYAPAMNEIQKAIGSPDLCLKYFMPYKMGCLQRVRDTLLSCIDAVVMVLVLIDAQNSCLSKK